MGTRVEHIITTCRYQLAPLTGASIGGEFQVEGCRTLKCSRAN